MKKSLLSLSVATAFSTTPAFAFNKVYDEASLLAAIDSANSDSTVHTIVFADKAYIELSAPVIYSGSQSLLLIGNGATLNGAAAGSFELDQDLTAITEDGSLIFNTAADITINHLTVENSATRGIVVNIPEDAASGDISVSLNRVNVLNSALYGVHIDDNADAFDDGSAGSEIGINLYIRGSNFTGNGTGAIDFDGVRVDERAEGDIHAMIVNSHIDGNGGDGIELDEAGPGSVDASMMKVTINGNGFYNEEDLDDGFDIDEADEGDLEVSLFGIEANNNMDEGLDFDEAGAGDVRVKVRHSQALNNADEGLKVDEEDAGNLDAKLLRVTVSDNGDDGIQFTELGEGDIEGKLFKVTANNNAKYGIKAEQWVLEDEDAVAEPAGSLAAVKTALSGNGKGDEIKVNNLVVQ
jgi:hypothetical protein